MGKQHGRAETQTEVERVYKKDGVTFKEEYSKDGSRAEVAMMLGNGVLLEVTGQGIGIEPVRAALASFGCKGLVGTCSTQISTVISRGQSSQAQFSQLPQTGACPFGHPPIPAHQKGHSQSAYNHNGHQVVVHQKPQD